MRRLRLVECGAPPALYVNPDQKNQAKIELEVCPRSLQRRYASIKIGEEFVDRGSNPDLLKCRRKRNSCFVKKSGGNVHLTDSAGHLSLCRAAHVVILAVITSPERKDV